MFYFHQLDTVCFRPEILDASADKGAGKGSMGKAKQPPAVDDGPEEGAEEEEDGEDDPEEGCPAAF